MWFVQLHTVDLHTYKFIKGGFRFTLQRYISVAALQIFRKLRSKGQKSSTNLENYFFSFSVLNYVSALSNPLNPRSANSKILPTHPLINWMRFQRGFGNFETPT